MQWVHHVIHTIRYHLNMNLNQLLLLTLPRGILAFIPFDSVTSWKYILFFCYCNQCKIYGYCIVTIIININTWTKILFFILLKYTCSSFAVVSGIRKADCLLLHVGSFPSMVFTINHSSIRWIYCWVDVSHWASVLGPLWCCFPHLSLLSRPVYLSHPP